MSGKDLKKGSHGTELKLVVEGYTRITDKDPLYAFKKTNMNDAVNMAEVLLEGVEVGHVLIVDEPTDAVLKEYSKGHK